MRRGVDGIVVSNHGGRQVDGAIASLDALPPIAEAVGDELAILFDSGIRSGADVLKALALGADAVCLGRPYVWGLALGGQAGVETVLKMVLAELDLTMALCGCTRPGPARPRRCSLRTTRPASRSWGRAAGPARPSGRRGGSRGRLSSRESSPSAASSCSLVRGR